MKNFDTLFEETKELNDRRLKAFLLLKENFNSIILPEFAKVLIACDYKIAFFRADNKIFSEDMFKYENYEYGTGDIEYCFGITKDGKIFSASHEYDGVYYKNTLLDDELSEIKNVGILELIRMIKSRTDKYNQKLLKDAEKAEELMK